MRSRAHGTPHPDNVPLRTFIHDQMRRRGWSYAAFARTIGADGRAVSGWLQDSKPTPAMTRQMAQRLGVDEDDLMGIVGHLADEPGEVTSEERSEGTLEQADLITKITQLPLSPGGYRTLNLVFEHLRKRES